MPSESTSSHRVGTDAPTDAPASVQESKLVASTSAREAAHRKSGASAGSALTSSLVRSVRRDSRALASSLALTSSSSVFVLLYLAGGAAGGYRWPRSTQARPTRARVKEWGLQVQPIFTVTHCSDSSASSRRRLSSMPPLPLPAARRAAVAI